MKLHRRAQGEYVYDKSSEPPQKPRKIKRRVRAFASGWALYGLFRRFHGTTIGPSRFSFKRQKIVNPAIEKRRGVLQYFGT